MRIIRILAVLLFLLPLAQLAFPQQMDPESMQEIRSFRLSDDLMLRYSSLVRASTAGRERRAGPETGSGLWPTPSAPGILPKHLDTAAALLERSEPIGPMLQAHHLTGKEYLSILFIRMGANESFAGRQRTSCPALPRGVIPPPKPWVSAENFSFLESYYHRVQTRNVACLH